MHFAAGVYGRRGDDLTLPYVIQFELARKRGWSDDPDDPGGATMIDVTLATYAAYRRKRGIPATAAEDLRRIQFGEWKEILKTMYWDAWRGDEIESQGIANLLVDWIWASGPSTVRRVQRILGVRPDGIVGQATVAAINSHEVNILFAKVMSERERYYRGCGGAWKYLDGWLRRLRAILPDGKFSIYGRII